MMLFDIRTSGRFIAPLMLAGGLLGCQPGQPTESDPSATNSSGTATASGARPGSPPPKAYETFDVVWETIEEKHFDPDHNGVDWDAVRLEYRPMVEDTRTEDEVRVVLSRMLNELGQSHFVIIPAPEK
ncbi:MAG: hypothetical protein GY871_18525, partial [Actinomycetales bacterium]|nr:hypothetical protein [Actinomycetales bacterium]